MLYFPARLFFKLPFFIVLYYLFSFCQPLFSQDEVDIINPGTNPFSLPRPGLPPCKLNLEGHPEWLGKAYMKAHMEKVTTPTMLQLIGGMGSDLPGMTGSPDMNDLFTGWFKRLSQKNDRKPSQPFNQTEANLDFKQPALLAFDSADEGWQVVLTIDEHGHLNASEQAEDKEEINATLEWEDLGAIWRNNKNELHTTSAEYTAEDFGDDTRVLTYLDTIGTNNLYYRTQADGTRVYIYRALDGKVYEVTAEDIKRSQQITYQYEMAKVSGEGLAAGGRVDYEGVLVPIRPAESDRSEGDKGILNQEIKAKQAPKNPSKSAQKRPHPYPNTKTAKSGAAKNTASIQKNGASGMTRTLRSSYAPSPQQNVEGMETDTTTCNYGYEDKETFSIRREPAELKVAPDGSFFAGIVRGKVVIYVPGQGKNKAGEIYPLRIPATSLSLSKDSSWMATTNNQELDFWRRGETVNHWEKSTGYYMDKTVKSMEFSPQGDYIEATLEDDSVHVVSRENGNFFELQPGELFAFNEHENFLITAKKCKTLGIALSYLSESTQSGDHNRHSLKFVDKKFQNLYLSPDAQMIVGLNENTQHVWRIESNGYTIAEYDDSYHYRRVNLSEDQSSSDQSSSDQSSSDQSSSKHSEVSDAFLDDNSVVIIRLSEGGFQLLRTTRNGKNRSNFVKTDFEWPINNDVKITNAFYIPDGDRVAAIFSDGSMRMLQNVAKKAGTQSQPVDPNFGTVLDYNGADSCFLVKDSAGNIIVRQWIKTNPTF